MEENKRVIIKHKEDNDLPHWIVPSDEENETTYIYIVSDEVL